MAKTKILSGPHYTGTTKRGKETKFGVKKGTTTKGDHSNGLKVR